MKRAKPKLARAAADGERKGCGFECVCRRKSAWGPQAAGGVARPVTLLRIFFKLIFKIKGKYESQHLKHLPGNGWYACCITLCYFAVAPSYTQQCQVCLQKVCASSPDSSYGVFHPGVNTVKGKSIFLCDLGASPPACPRPGGKLANSKLL